MGKIFMVSTNFSIFLNSTILEIDSIFAGEFVKSSNEIFLYLSLAPMPPGHFSFQLSKFQFIVLMVCAVIGI